MAFTRIFRRLLPYLLVGVPLLLTLWTGNIWIMVVGIGGVILLSMLCQSVRSRGSRIHSDDYQDAWLGGAIGGWLANDNDDHGGSDSGGWFDGGWEDGGWGDGGGDGGGGDGGGGEIDPSSGGSCRNCST